MGTYLLTGAGSGIGETLADALRDRGDDLVLLARTPERAEDLAGRYPRAGVLVADLSEPLVLGEALAGRLPARLDTIVHSAGVAEVGPMEDQGAATWRHTFDVNVVAPAELTRLLLPALRASRGQVVLVNSGAGLNARPGWSSYAASKHGLKALADSLRGEEQENGVRVISVYPGRVATPMQEKVHAQEGKEYDPSAWIAPSSVVTTMLAAMDLPRDAEVTDVSVRPGP